MLSEIGGGESDPVGVPVHQTGSSSWEAQVGHIVSFGFPSARHTPWICSTCNFKILFMLLNF